MIERDFDSRPYSPDETRVATWLVGRCPDIGSGDDPIGFVLASYELIIMQRNNLANAVREVCGNNHMNCSGASRVKAALRDSQ